MTSLEDLRGTTEDAEELVFYRYVASLGAGEEKSVVVKNYSRPSAS